MNKLIIPSLKLFDTPELLAQSAAQELGLFIAAQMRRNRETSIVLSGGSTPKLLFKELVKVTNQQSLSWKNVLIFWGDERCVDPDHPESNYGTAKLLLLNHILIPESNVFRMRGENHPEKEADRYSGEIRKRLNIKNGNLPVFDWIFLGLGTDGHTASLFPGSSDLSIINRICTATRHPGTGQNRLTLTLPVLNSARRISFLITGIDKSKVSSEIYHRKTNSEQYPAARVQPIHGSLEWYIDKAAASDINPPR